VFADKYEFIQCTYVLTLHLTKEGFLSHWPQVTTHILEVLQFDTLDATSFQFTSTSLHTSQELSQRASSNNKILLTAGYRNND
jgi:hypothetical protein